MSDFLVTVILDTSQDIQKAHSRVSRPIVTASVQYRTTSQLDLGSSLWRTAVHHHLHHHLHLRVNVTFKFLTSTFTMTSHLPPNSSSSRSYHQPQFPVSPHPNQPTSPLPGPSPKPKPVTNSLINLLVIIILNSLKSELVHTALFFSERLHALIPSSELAVWLLSLSLLRSGNHQATVHLLKNTPIFIPHHPNPGIPPSESNSKGKARQFDDDPFNIQHPTDEMDQSLWDWNHQGSVKGTQRAAHSASTRCALVYSKACNLINRPKEGLEVYLKAIDRFGLPSISDGSFLQLVT